MTIPQAYVDAGPGSPLPALVVLGGMAAVVVLVLAVLLVTRRGSG